MSLTSWQYFAFLGLALLAVRSIRGASAAKLFLFVASCAFYAFFDVRLLPVLLAMGGLAYLVARLVASVTEARHRRWVLAAGIGLELGVLGIFKYYDFFTKSIANLMSVDPPGALGLLLPVGISFVTFQVIAYLVDVYRGDLEVGRPLDFLLMVMFFPHLVAGPILKPRDFLPQLQGRFLVNWDNVERSLPGFLLGLFKKVVIADGMARFIAAVFAKPASFGSTTVWLAVIAYSVQIYADFSGYSDIAIASAKCFGLEIPANFNLPYLAKNVSEFWRRWHISLSTWFREYVYFPLGGSRRGLAVTCFNTMVVMLLSGLWHGAGWNFIIWGFLHGIAMVTQRLFRAVVPRPADGSSSRLGAISSWALTFVWLCIAWVFFRSPDVQTAVAVLQKMAFQGDTGGIVWPATQAVTGISLVAAGHLVGRKYKLPERVAIPSFAGAFVLTAIILAVLVFAPDTASPFIYVQF